MAFPSGPLRLSERRFTFETGGDMSGTRIQAAGLALLGFTGLIGARPAPGPAPVAGSGPTVAASPLRLVLAPTGNEARYRVREQLANLAFPSDAVGATTNLTGTIVLGEDGRIVRGESKIVADLTTLKSVQERRDLYLQRRTLETAQYPTIELALTRLEGLPNPVPRSGRVSFTAVGDLTIKGVTRPTTWAVTAEASDRGFTGTAATRFTFEDFGLTKPRLMLLLSVEDTIRLEYDFHLVPEGRDRR